MNLKPALSYNEQIKKLKDINKTFQKYNGVFRLSYMGFPKNWNDILSQ